MTKTLNVKIDMVMPGYMNVDHKAYTSLAEIASNDVNHAT